LRPRLATKYPSIKFIEYAETTPVKITKLIKSLQARNEPYMFLRDRDEAPCVTKRKEAVLNKYRSVEASMLYVVVTEIESWYLAGIPQQFARKLGTPQVDATELVTKEMFYRAMPKKYRSKVDWLTELLKVFSVSVAKAKNASFRYFSEKAGF
jgi:hypothetical protein